MAYRGISFILSSIVFHVIPTALEITMVCGILVWRGLMICVFLTSFSVLEVRLGFRSCDRDHHGPLHMVHCSDHRLEVSAMHIKHSLDSKIDAELDFGEKPMQPTTKVLQSLWIR